MAQTSHTGRSLSGLLLEMGVTWRPDESSGWVLDGSLVNRLPSLFGGVVAREWLAAWTSGWGVAEERFALL